MSPADPSPLFTAVLLAGGLSTRMGRDKAGLILEGKPLWRRQLDTLQAAEPHQILISGRPNGPYATSGFEIVYDETPGLGPLAGVTAALRRSRCERVVVLAIDLPRMTSAFLTALARQAARADRGVVPRTCARIEPLSAVYSRGCLPLIEECLRRSDRSMQRFVGEALQQELLIEHFIADVEQPYFINLNTEADWRAAGGD